jgi:hypothetical protein
MGTRIYLHSFTASALDGGERLVSRSCLLIPDEKPRKETLDKKLGKLKGRSATFYVALYYIVSRDSAVGIATGYGLDD